MAGAVDDSITNIILGISIINIIMFELLNHTSILTYFDTQFLFQVKCLFLCAVFGDGLMNVRKCSAEHGSPHFGAPHMSDKNFLR